MNLAITRRAAEWYVINQEGNSDIRQRKDFLSWLKESPDHVREYLAVASLVQDVSAVSGTVDAEVGELLRTFFRDKGEVIFLRHAAPTDNRRRQGEEKSGRRIRPAAVATSIVLICLVTALVAGFRQQSMFNGFDAYQTRHAEQRSWTLSDGSVMHLNGNSRVEVDFSDNQRVVLIDRGQAYFQVSKDPDRKFVVNAGGINAVAVGTAFEVYRLDNETKVTVAEGRVVVLSGDVADVYKLGFNQAKLKIASTGNPSGTEDTVPTKVDLTAGKALTVDGKGRASEVLEVDVQQETAWLRRQIIFHDKPLGEVVEEFNRYGTLQIDIADPHLRDLKISGIFNAYDTESFISFLGRLDGVFIEKEYKNIYVRSGILKAEN